MRGWSRRPVKSVSLLPSWAVPQGSCGSRPVLRPSPAVSIAALSPWAALSSLPRLASLPHSLVAGTGDRRWIDSSPSSQVSVFTVMMAGWGQCNRIIQRVEIFRVTTHHKVGEQRWGEGEGVARRGTQKRTDDVASWRLFPGTGF